MSGRPTSQNWRGTIPLPSTTVTSLGPGAELHGPAIVEERESTVLIGPRGSARVDDVLNLIVELV